MKFMVIGLPRSGTTWVANWLSTDDCLVQHDPLYRAHYTDWERKFQAVSCTGIWRWPEWVNAQKCPKIILHRPEAEIMSALDKLGISDAIQPGDSDWLNDIGGHHVVWDHPITSWAEALRTWDFAHPDHEFDKRRWQAHVEMNVQPALQHIKPDRKTTERLVDEVFDMARKRR